MSEHENGRECPFSGHDGDLVNMKFFRGRRDDVITVEEIGEQVRSATMQQRLKTATVSVEAPRSAHPVVDVRELVAGL